MKAKPIFTISFSNELPDSDREHLLNLFSEYVELSPIRDRQVSPDWLVMVGFMKDFSTVIGGVGSIAKLAQELLAWRKKAKGERIGGEIRINRPAKGALDVYASSDQELIDWFDGLGSS